jgi:hypothetical protein
VLSPKARLHEHTAEQLLTDIIKEVKEPEMKEL